MKTEVCPRIPPILGHKVLCFFDVRACGFSRERPYVSLLGIFMFLPFGILWGCLDTPPPPSHALLDMFPLTACGVLVCLCTQFGARLPGMCELAKHRTLCRRADRAVK